MDSRVPIYTQFVLLSLGSIAGMVTLFVYWPPWEHLFTVPVGLATIGFAATLITLMTRNSFLGYKKIKRPDKMYKEVEKLIDRVEDELLICAPTFSFGSYDLGIRITDEILQSIERCCHKRRRITVRCIINEAISSHTAINLADFLSSLPNFKARLYETPLFFFIRNDVRQKEIVEFRALTGRPMQSRWEGGSNFIPMPEEASLDRRRKTVENNIRTFEELWNQTSDEATWSKLRSIVEEKIKQLEQWISHE